MEVAIQKLRQSATCDKRCSDYDSDCKKVKSPLLCWIGGMNVCRNGVIAETPIADGYCPLLRK